MVAKELWSPVARQKTEAPGLWGVQSDGYTQYLYVIIIININIFIINNNKLIILINNNNYC